MGKRKKIGIITGSGPEAGLDLWAKVLVANKRLLGKRFRGDLDAPQVVVISEPQLGLSMELERHHEAVWRHLKTAAAKLAPLADYYAIACNTLNVFQHRLETLDLSARLVSFTAVISDFIRANHINDVCLLGARPVMDLGPWSAYRRLPDIVDVEIFKDADQLHQLIYDIKIHGPDGNGLASRFGSLLSDIQSDTVLLACTELPLIKNVTTHKTLLDITELVAAKLAKISLNLSTS